MNIFVYPSDLTGCGYYRQIWPAERLIQQGHDVTIAQPDERDDIKAAIDQRTNKVIDAFCPEDADVLVFGRVTHPILAQAIPFYRAKGIAVVVDIDDDLVALHHANPVHAGLKPGGPTGHSWEVLAKACRQATLVTCSTPQLAARYGTKDNTRVLPNYLPDDFFGRRWQNAATLCWPAAFETHPDDLKVLGPTLQQLGHEHPEMKVLAVSSTEQQQRDYGVPEDKIEDPLVRVQRILKLEQDPVVWPPVSIYEWPQRLTEVGIGLAPLANTRFNRAKSWLKPLEMSAIGVPWVASPRVEYTRLVKEMGVGVLASNPREWHDELTRLIEDEDRRLELSARLRSAALAFKIRDHAWRWLEVWEEAAKLERNHRPAGQEA